MFATNGPATCPRCDFELPSDARFCPKCGKQVLDDETMEHPVDPHLERIRTAEQELPAQLGRRRTASVHRIERRPLGVAPVPLLGGLALGALILAIVLGIAAGPIPGIGLLVVSAALFALLLTGVRRQPDSPISQVVSGLIVRTRDTASFSISSLGTWTTTGREIISLRARRFRLQRQLRRRLTPLGEAVHQSDAARAEELKAELADLQRQLEEARRHESAALTAAQSAVERERAPVQQTEVFSAVSSQSEGDQEPVPSAEPGDADAERPPKTARERIPERERLPRVDRSAA